MSAVATAPRSLEQAPRVVDVDPVRAHALAAAEARARVLYRP